LDPLRRANRDKTRSRQVHVSCLFPRHINKIDEIHVSDCHISMMQLGQSMADNCEFSRTRLLCKYRGIRYQLVRRPARAADHKKITKTLPHRSKMSLRLYAEGSFGAFPSEGKSTRALHSREQREGMHRRSDVDTITVHE